MRPSFDERVYPAYKLAAMVDVLREEGVSPATTLRGSGIDDKALHAPATRISYKQLITVYRNALALATSPVLALEAGRRMHLTACGIYGYALMSSGTGRDAFDFAVKYQRILGPAVDVSYRRVGERIVWHHAPLITVDPRDSLYRFALEYHFAISMNLYRDAVGAFQPLEMRVAYPAPSHAARYQDYFGCPVLFDQPHDELDVSASLLDQRLLYSNPITNAMVREICERELTTMFTHTGTAGRIYRILIENPRDFPDIDRLATDLAVSARTLRRRLEMENTSYRQILSDVRKHLAIKFLRETPMTNEEIADRLGYSDAASFRKAFKHWTKEQPSGYRMATPSAATASAL